MGMAKRSYSKKGRKMEPSVMTLYLPTVPISGSPVTQYLDLSQVASLMNRRFYRQGINWAVAGIKVLSQTGYLGSITVSKLPNTWVMANSWEKSFRAWQRMNREALAESESVRPKFLDFKIYADAGHHTAGFAANILPQSLGGVFAAGEWSPSKIYVPTAQNATAAGTTDFELIATGASFPGAGATGLPAVSLIEGYAASRGLPNVLDPNAPDDAEDASGTTPENWMAALFNDGNTQTQEVIDDMITENNIAPYPFENDGTATDTQYPGGANQGSGLQIHDVEFITSSTIGGTTRLKGGNFPCGLIRFDMTNTGSTSNLVIQVDLVPGNHRGYLCEPMTEM